MTRWHVIPILAGILATGAPQAQAADVKSGASNATESTLEAPPPRRRAYRNRPQAEVVPEPAYTAPAPVYAGRPVLRPSPSDPFSGVTLPRQSGDAAYQGGGVVLEQDDNGVNRRVR